MDFAVTGFKALNDDKWPTYLSMKKVVAYRNLGSVNNCPIINGGEIESFNYDAARVFNLIIVLSTVLAV